MPVTIMTQFLFLGCGGVGQAFLHILPKVLPQIPFSHLTIIDAQDRSLTPAVKTALRHGATFKQIRVTRDNLFSILSFLKTGDFVIDLSVGIDGQSVLEWCQNHGVMYINTALELWEDDVVVDGEDWVEKFKKGDVGFLEKRTLYMRQLDVKKAFNVGGRGPTAILDHGMNPGLVSHFTKSALEKIALSVLQTTPTNPDLHHALQTKNHALLAHTLNLRTIHISEQDTQQPYPQHTKTSTEFLSTWSCDGFIEEGLDPAQIGWGTHEKTLPPNSIIPSVGHTPTNPPHQIFMPVRGIQLQMKSYVPTCGEITGYNIPHSEGATLADYLSVSENSQIVYRPTVHYVYRPPPCAIESWEEVITNGLQLPKSTRVLSGEEIASGKDAVGVLLIFSTNPFSPPSSSDNKPWSYWAGTILDITQTRLLSPYSAPTTVQVVASLAGAISWALAHPNQGINWPESVPHEWVLGVAERFLGDVVFGEVKWGGEPSGCQFVDFMV